MCCACRARTNGGTDSPGFVSWFVSTKNNLPSRNLKKGLLHSGLAQWLSIFSPLLRGITLRIDDACSSAFRLPCVAQYLLPSDCACSVTLFCVIPLSFAPFSRQPVPTWRHSCIAARWSTRLTSFHAEGPALSTKLFRCRRSEESIYDRHFRSRPRDSSHTMGRSL